MHSSCFSNNSSLKMDTTFYSHFKSSELRRQANLLEVQEIEKKSRKKLSYLKNTPESHLTQKLRAKRSKLVKDFPGLFKANQNDQTILVVSLSPLFFLNVDRVTYCYMRRPQAKNNLKKKQAMTLFNEFKIALQRQMNASKKYKFIFDKLSKEYLNIYDIINGESTLFLSPLPNIKNIEDELRKFAPLENSRFYETLQSLERFVEKNNTNKKFYRTHEEFIESRHAKEKQTVINFISMNDDSINSSKLGSLYKQVAQGKIELSQLSNLVKQSHPSWEYVKRQTVEEPEHANQIFTYLRKEDPKFFRKYFGIAKKNSISREKRLAAIIKKVGLDPSQEQIDEIINHLRERYIEEDEPIFQGMRFKIVKLLLRVSYKISMKKIFFLFFN